MAASKGMIQLEDGHMIIEQTLAAKLAPGAKQEPIDLRIADFDDVIYRIYISPEEKNIVTVSIGIRCFAEIQQFGGNVLLDEEYAGMLGETQEGFDLTVQFDVNNPPDTPENIIRKCSQLKRNLIGAPLDQCFAALTDGSAGSMPPIQIHVRENESMYLIPRDDRVIVIFSVVFADPTDQALANVFLQEFAEAQRRVGGSPPVSFSKDPPMELKEMDTDEVDGLVGYVSFVIFNSHVAGGKHRKAVSRICGFRNYLHYHIKCSKSYLASRMRKRVALLLQVLRRATPTDPNKEKKTIGGKTFRRNADRK